MNKIKELELKIATAQNAYYNGSEIISDDEYDALVYELSSLDPSNKLLHVVGAEPSKEWVKEKHLHPLGSLNKVNFPDEMTKWISDAANNKPVMVVEKLDGLSLGCQYEGGKLVKACLRGNGFEGENILKNVLKMENCVKQITTDKKFTGTIRGEIVLTKSNHNAYFPEYSNPRNAASGLCRRSDSEGSEYLTLMMYDVISDTDISTEEEKFNFLKQNKFSIPNYKLCKKSNEVNDLWKLYQDKTRDSLDYEIDGLVVCINDLDAQESLGETNLRPKGKMAFKFANKFISTVVKNITWATGNSGRITPICWVEPVNLLGSNVEKASVYNVANVESLGLDVGAQVLICKANEIIPKIEKVIKSTGTIAKTPKKCGDCNADLEMQGKNLTCTNSLECPSQVCGRIESWIKDLNILEWGTGLISKLVESGKVVTIADLYKLTVDDLASLDRMGEKSANKCYNLLWAYTEIPLDIFVGGLSLQMIGSSTIRACMSAGHDTLDKLLSMKISDFESVPGVGPIKAQFLFDGLKKNKALIDELLGLGLTIKKKIVGNLSNKSFCFTGALSEKRPVLEQMVIDAGGTVKNSVGKDLMFLVSADPDDSTSTKSQKAIKNGTKIIGEQQFMKMLK